MFLTVIEKEAQPAGNRGVSQALSLSLGAAERISGVLSRNNPPLFCSCPIPQEMGNRSLRGWQLSRAATRLHTTVVFHARLARR
ncbi:hypothetical protein CEXT_548811 [Caerostris extrusa]|uniref:Uncharacterized protein n=1 Tax=Caerostris extrusa TaxID=172846 RepID=A0AAV4XJF9_CAEEX|nr:hypothetical protein CEXT_548811 [Caerostris extrusa]